MANLYRYADSNSKSGFFLRGRSKNGGYYNLQTTPAANQLFLELDYEAGRLFVTEGDSVPGELTWRMFQVGLLKTDNQDSALNTLTDDDLEETFRQTDARMSLSEQDRNTLANFIESYSGINEDRVEKLASLLDIENSTTTTSNASGADFDLSGAIEAEEKRKRVEAAGTSFDEIKSRIEQLENAEKRICDVTLNDVTSLPSGPHSFTRFWEHPADIKSIFGTDVLEEDTFQYTLDHPSETAEVSGFAVTDYTVLGSSAGVIDESPKTFEGQAVASSQSRDYVLGYYNKYDPADTPRGEEYSLYLKERPNMSHRAEIKDGRITSWEAEVTEHGWSRQLRLVALRKAAKNLSYVVEFFENISGYQLDSPGQDYNELSIQFEVENLSEDQKEMIRGAKKDFED